MEGVIQDQGQDHELRLARSDSEQHQQEEIWGPEVEISPEDAANYTKCLSPDAPPIYTRSSMTVEEGEDLNLRLARYRIAYYKVPMLQKPPFVLVKFPFQYLHLVWFL
jgi:hypothetical protein